MEQRVPLLEEPWLSAGEPPQKYQRGRVCARCGTRLNLYNPGPECLPCDFRSVSRNNEPRGIEVLVLRLVCHEMDVPLDALSERRSMQAKRAWSLALLLCEKVGIERSRTAALLGISSAVFSDTLSRQLYLLKTRPDLREIYDRICGEWLSDAGPV